MVSIAERRCTEGTHQLQYVAADIHALMHSLHGRDVTCATKLAPTLLAEVVTSTEPVCYLYTHSTIVHRQLPLSQVIDCGRVAHLSPFAHSDAGLFDKTCSPIDVARSIATPRDPRSPTAAATPIHNHAGSIVDGLGQTCDASVNIGQSGCDVIALAPVCTLQFLLGSVTQCDVNAQCVILGMVSTLTMLVVQKKLN